MPKGNFFLTAVVCLFLALTVKTENKLSVSETEITASIQNNQMQTNLFVENPARAFSAKVRLEILDTTDRIIARSETDETIKNGRNALTIPVSLHEKNYINELLWYRLRYTIVSANNPATGIVSLSEIIPELFALRVSASQQVFAGMNYVAHVRAFHPTKAGFIPGVKLDGKLTIYSKGRNNSDNKNLEIKASGLTGSDGFATLNFRIPAAVRFSDSYWGGNIEIAGEKNNLKNSLSESLHSPQNGFFVYLNTDKPLYQPGQKINIRGLALYNDFAGLARNVAAEENLEFLIKDEQNIVLYRETVKTSRFGIASVGWQIPDNAKLGSYHIEVKSDKNNQPSQHNFKVSRYELPQFIVKTKANKDFYLPSENMAEVTIDAVYLFGKPVEKGKVKIVRESQRRWDYASQKWDINEEETYEGETDADGKFFTKIDLSPTHEKLAGGEAQYEDLSFTAYFTDSTTNRTEQRRFDLRATKEPIHVYLIGKTNNRRNPKLPVDFFVSTFAADGKPLVCDVEIKAKYDDKKDEEYLTLKKVKTNSLGAAKVEFRIPAIEEGANADDLKLKIIARDAEKRVGTREQGFSVDESEKQILIQTDKAIYRKGEPIKIDVLASESEETVFVDVMKNRSNVVSTEIKLKNGRGRLQIPYASGFQNNLVVSAYFDAGDRPAGDTQGIIYPTPSNLEIDINSDKEIYRPNEEATFNFAVSSPENILTENALGIVILDKAVEERARTDSNFGGAVDIFSSFGGLLGYGNGFGGLTQRDLEEMDLKKPVSPEFQLAAAVMFENSYFEPHIFRGNYYYNNPQYAFGENSRKQLEPVQRALQFRYANTYENPGDEESLKRILYQNNIDFENMRDPWGNRYRVEILPNRNYNVFQIWSNGANKISNDQTSSGEKDDFIAMQMYFEYFKPTGMEINEAVQDFYRKTGKFVRDRETLRAALAAKNINLDDLKDRWGEPYRTNFGVGGRFYTISFQSGGTDKKFTDNYYDDFFVWTSQIDYFTETEKKIEAILNNFIKEEQTFPKDEAEFKAVLKSGGVDFDSLRDGWNRPFYLETQTLSRLADRVKIEDVAKQGEQAEEKLTITPVMQQLAIFRLRSMGDNGAKETDYRDPVFSNFAGVVAEQTKEDALPKLTVSKKVLTNGKAAIYGMIVDANQAVIANAPVKITNLETQKTYELESNHSGVYLQTNLPAGKYSVRADAPGFKSLIVTEIAVKPEIFTEINLKLEVGTVSEVVTVTGTIDQIVNTTDASIGNTFSSAQISNLPINGRNFSSLLSLSPGVRREGYAAGAWLNSDVGYIIDGASGAENSFVIDGQEIANFRSGQLNENNGLPIQKPKSTPRLREYFPETLLWSPEIITDSNGNAQLKLKLADNITTWKMYTIASNLEGKIGIAQKEFKAFQPFFVDLSPPQVLTTGDEIFLPVQIRNYTETKQTVDVEMAKADWFSFLDAEKRQIEVGSNSTQNAIFAFRADKASEDGRQKVTAIADSDSDAMEKSVVIKPNGKEIVKTASEIFRDKVSFDVNFPSNALPDTPKAEVKIYPNLFAHVAESVEGLLQRPYGCGEQTISSTYPNLMILKITKENHKLRPIAHKYLQKGYERLLGYQVESGGFSYWGGKEEANISLTAYALRFLNDARGFIQVDENVIRKAQNWIISQQKPGGTWTTQYYGETAEDKNRTKQMTTYLARSLAMTERIKKEKTPELQTSLRKAFAYLKTSNAAIEEPYALANFGLALLDAGDTESAQTIVEKLQKMAITEGGTAFWNLETNTPFYGWGTAGRIETTALVVQLLSKFKSQNPKFKAGEIGDLISKGTLYLLKNKDRYGVWYSTQATVNVLNAITDSASGESTEKQTERVAEIFVNGQKTGEVKLPPTNELSFPQIAQIPGNFLSPNNLVEIKIVGSASATMAQIVQSHYIPWQAFIAESANANSRHIRLDYDCDRQQAQPTEEITCEVKTERVGSRGYGMLLAEIGLPPGADVDRASLEKAKSENWSLSRYEVLPDRIVVYMWSNPGGTRFNFKFRPRYGINAQTPASIVYDYYNEEAKAIVAPLKFNVR